MTRRALGVFAVVVAAITLSACGGSTEPRSVTVLSAATATALSGTVGTAVAPTPAVRVRDQDGNPVQGVSVAFEVTAGGGTVDNATAVTDASGTASAGAWVLGPAAGTHTLTASAAGLTPVVFTAQAQVNVCEVRTSIAVGAVANGTLAAGDCVISGGFADNYSLTIGASQAIEIGLSSLDFDTFLAVGSANGVPIATNDDSPGVTTTNSRIKLLAAGGLHTVSATSFGPLMSGAYTLRIDAVPESADECDLVFIERGVTTQQTLSDSDCLLEPPYFDDQFVIFLAAGSQIRVRHNTQEFDAYLLLLTPGGAVVAQNDDAAEGTSDAQIVYTAAASGFYVISASSTLEQETGAYTLIVDTPPPAVQAGPLSMGPTSGGTTAAGRKRGAGR